MNVVEDVFKGFFDWGDVWLRLQVGQLLLQNLQDLSDIVNIRSTCTRTNQGAATVPKSTSNSHKKQSNHSSSSEGTVAVKQHDEYYFNCIASYLKDVNENLVPQNIATEESVQVHVAQMKSYLDEFDKIMTNSN